MGFSPGSHSSVSPLVNNPLSPRVASFVFTSTRYTGHGAHNMAGARLPSRLRKHHASGALPTKPTTKPLAMGFVPLASAGYKRRRSAERNATGGQHQQVDIRTVAGVLPPSLSPPPFSNTSTARYPTSLQAKSTQTVSDPAPPRVVYHHDARLAEYVSSLLEPGAILLGHPDPLRPLTQRGP